ncbi:MAG: TolC family protein [Flavisolibacter sp.]|nr:TolC family protein [Flavisolibacter sp.]
MNRVLFLFVFFVLLTRVVAAQNNAGKVYTLQECIETAIANNVQVKQSAVLAERAEVAWKQSKMDLLPNLNAQVGHGINSGRSIDPFTNTYVNQRVNYANYGIGTNVVLFNGGTLRNTITQYGLAHEAAKMELQQLKDNITINVMLAYLQVLNNEELLVMAKNAAAVTQKQVERLEVLNQSGAISPPLLHDMRAQLMNDQLASVNYQNALATSRLTLSQLMNIPFDRSMQLERINVDDVIYNTVASDEVYQRAIQQLGIVRAAQLRKRSAEAALQAMRGQLFPTVALNGGFNTNYSSAAERQTLVGTTEVPSSNYVTVNGNKFPVTVQQSNYQSQRITYFDQLQNNVYRNIGVSLRLPIFNSFQTRSRIKLARLDVKNSDLLIEGAQLQLRQEVEQAHLNMTNAFEQFTLLQQQVQEYAESFRAAEVRFNAGVGTIVEYLIAKNNLDRANNNLIVSKYDYALRKKILDYYSGTFVK